MNGPGNSDAASKRVAAVIVNWNACETTAACLASLLSPDGTRPAVVVVDNGSNDGSPEKLRRRFPGITMLEAGRNLGFGRAVNMGARLALRDPQVRFIFLLNNDAVVEARTLSRLLAALEADPRAGAAVPKILFGDGRRLWYGGGRMDWKTGTGVHCHKGETDRGQADEVGTATFASGCALLIRREALGQEEVFDPRYFFMGEDVDLCLRLRRRGNAILYVPTALVRHDVGVTSGRQGRPFIWYHMTRNRLLTVRKHAGAVEKAGFFLWWPALWTCRTLSFLLEGDTATVKAVWRGIRDYRAGRFDKGSPEP